MAERFLIAPFSSGIEKDLPVWQTPESSFHKLNNAYIHQGVIKKRFGSEYIGTATSELLGQLKSRLRIKLGTTDAGGNIGTVIAGPVLAATPIPVGSVFKTGQMFSIGDDIFTVPEVGAPVIMLTNSATASTYTYNTTNGTYVIHSSVALTDCYFYPTEPVMGLTMFEAGTISDHSAIAFDTRFAYLYTATGWGRVGAQIYTGDNLDYFYSHNFEGTAPEDTALFTTNFKSTDSMYRTLDKSTWTAFSPVTTAAPAVVNTILTAKIIKAFKSHLCLFNTIEKLAGGAAKAFVNRVRYSSVGNPLHADAFLESKQAGYIGGGYIDAPTEEAIISVQYIKDGLIVYFERSTYQLAYTYDSSLPFVWRKISSDLGSTSAFSSIPVKESVFTIGTTGVNACDGVNVVRADTKIPDKIAKYLKVSDALKRIHGIKEYGQELLYWTFPAQQAGDAEKYPDKVLVYNYSNRSWATYDDSITCFGYFEQTLAETWEDDYQVWEDDTSTWDSASEVQGHRRVIAGNQHGFVFALSNEKNSNAPVLQISKIDGVTITANEHNLTTGDYVRLHNSGVPAQDIIYRVQSTPTDNTLTVDGLAVPSYGGSATLSSVSNVDIKSTAWNPYNKKGRNISLSKIIFCVKRTVNGEITVNFVPSQANLDMISQGFATYSNMGTNVLETFPYDLVPLEASQDLLWHSVYFQAEGNSVQIHINWSDSQMLDKNIVSSDFEIQGIILETTASGTMG